MVQATSIHFTEDCVESITSAYIGAAVSFRLVQREAQGILQKDFASPEPVKRIMEHGKGGVGTPNGWMVTGYVNGCSFP